MIRVAHLALLAAFAGANLQVASAAERTITLSVPGMNCALCPVTIKAALSRVSGVIKTQASYDSKEAVVTFDDAQTSVTALMQATANVGYPSSIKK